MWYGWMDDGTQQAIQPVLCQLIILDRHGAPELYSWIPYVGEDPMAINHPDQPQQDQQKNI